jgi:hypothetical protein
MRIVKFVAPCVAFVAALIPPPPPPPVSHIGPQQPQNAVNVPRLAPPPPPPSFIPPQLRHRPPMAPPPRMPVPPHIMPGGGPPGGSGPPMHPGMMAPPPHMLRTPGLPPGAYPRPMIPPAMAMPMMRPPTIAMGMHAPNYGYAPNCPPMTNEPPRSEPVQVTPAEQPKVVYAAPPVRASGTVTEENGCLGSTVRTEVTLKATHQNASSTSSEVKYSARGIELNVPVEKIEVEKKQNSSVAQPSGVAAAVETATSSSSQAAANKKEKKDKKKKFVRMAAGTVWEDTTLADWDPGMLCAY